MSKPWISVWVSFFHPGPLSFISIKWNEMTSKAHHPSPGSLCKSTSLIVPRTSDGDIEGFIETHSLFHHCRHIQCKVISKFGRGMGSWCRILLYNTSWTVTDSTAHDGLWFTLVLLSQAPEWQDYRHELWIQIKIHRKFHGTQSYLQRLKDRP